MQFDGRRRGRVLGAGTKVGKLQHGLDLAGEHVAAGGNPADDFRASSGILPQNPPSSNCVLAWMAAKGALSWCVVCSMCRARSSVAAKRRRLVAANSASRSRKAPARREARNQIVTEIRATEPTWVVKIQGAADARPCAAGGAGCHIDRAGNAPKLSAVTHDTYMAMAIAVTARLSAEEKKMQTKTM